LAKKITEYQPQPDPYVEQRKQLELRLLEAQANNEQAKAEENRVDIELKSAKARTELAKSRNLDSKSDKEDLDFVRTQSGKTAQEELDKKDFDRRMQLDLKAADAMLKGSGQPEVQ